MAQATVELKLKPWLSPNFAQVERPPATRQEGLKELPSIPVADLPLASLTALAEGWLNDLYAKAGKKPNWTFDTVSTAP